MSTDTSSRISSPAVSSREYPSEGRSSRTRIFCSVMSRPAHSDYHTSKEILKLIEDVNIKYGNTVIMVTHNEAIRHMADHVIKLRDGEVRHNEINTDKVSAADLEW